jgi:hypothetical protein
MVLLLLVVLLLLLTREESSPEDVAVLRREEGKPDMLTAWLFACLIGSQKRRKGQACCAEVVLRQAVLQDQRCCWA